MENKKAATTPFHTLHHIGAVVKDCDKAAEVLQSLGLPVFEPVVIAAKERTLHGKPIGPSRLKVRQAHVGPIRFEMIEYIDGTDHICKETLDKRGEGLYHVAFVVENVDKGSKELARQGYDVVFRSKYVNGGGMAYYDTDKVGGVLFELIQRPDDYVPKNKRLPEK